ncbi:putative uncharacterized protein [Clostridium sp. CAG:356]|jgi:hypothetical protein|nr:putative uncharacterized protein [Clostridium sp. CAG:356]
MSSSLVEVIKKMAVGANDANAPTSVLFGTVTSVEPLEITVDQKFKLTERFLMLTKNVKDYKVDVTMDWNTENTSLDANHSHSTEVDSNISVSSDISPNDNNQKITNDVTGEVSVSVKQKDIDLTHKHSIKGTKSITVHNALKINDNVILIQQQGGINFVVLDKF